MNGARAARVRRVFGGVQTMCLATISAVEQCAWPRFSRKTIREDLRASLLTHSARRNPLTIASNLAREASTVAVCPMTRM